MIPPLQEDHASFMTIEDRTNYHPLGYCVYHKPQKKKQACDSKWMRSLPTQLITLGQMSTKIFIASDPLLLLSNLLWATQTCPTLNKRPDRSIPKHDIWQPWHLACARDNPPEERKKNLKHCKMEE